MTLRNIPIRTDYSDPQAQFLEFDAYDDVQRAQLHEQEHVNIRTFEGAAVKSPTTVLELDALLINTLSNHAPAPGPGLQMGALDGLDSLGNSIYTQTRGNGETWTVGTQGKQASYHYWRGLSRSVTTGANATQSVDTVRTVDLLTGFDDDDYVTIALPTFPNASIDKSLSYIEFTSATNGTFGGTDRILFTSNLNTWAAGNMELRFKRQLVFASLVGAARDDALSAVTGVKFNFQATGSVTVIVLAMRLVSKNWVYAPVDIDTRLQRLELTPSLDGSNPVSAFPIGTVPSVPTDFPPLYWADVPSGVTDPRPIDGEFGVAFNAGSSGGGSPTNQISLYMREIQLVTLKQLDLDINYDQQQLEVLNRQPEYTTAGWVERPRTQDEIDPLDQDSLDDDTQFTLDALPDFEVASWIEARLTWDQTGAVVMLSDNLGNSYSFSSFTLMNGQDYFMTVHLEDTTLRIKIFEMDTNPNGQSNSTTGTVQSTKEVFDSYLIVNPVWIRRRQGRVGYYAKFGIGDACIYQILPRGLMFAEFKTKALTSITPVRGAQIFYGGAANRELFVNWVSGPFGGTLVPDTVKSHSGKSIRIVNNGQANLQGVQSNSFFVDDFKNTRIEFDINFPSSAIQAGSSVEAFLYGEFGRIIPLKLNVLTPDKWEHIRFDLTSFDDSQTGYYRIVLIQTGAGHITDWFLDNPSIVRRSLTFSARGRRNNAWHDFPEGWIPLGTHQVNNTRGGALFETRERTLQARANAISQDAYVDNLRIVPIYAELGRFVWADEDGVNQTPPTATLTMVRTTAAAPIGAGDTSIQVGSTTDFPSIGKLLIDQEIVSYSGLASGPIRFTGCVRGLDGTTAASHSSGVDVFPTPFKFIGSGTPSTDETITIYEWDFGDGEQDFGPVVNHTYDEPGTYTVGLIVVDSANRRANVNLPFTF